MFWWTQVQFYLEHSKKNNNVQKFVERKGCGIGAMLPDGRKELILRHSQLIIVNKSSFFSVISLNPIS